VNKNQKRTPRPEPKLFRGYSWCVFRARWRASIRVGTKAHSLGYFCDQELAARAYDRAAFRLLGHNARLNFGVPNAIQISETPDNAVLPTGTV